MTPRFIPDLIDIEQELFDLPQKVLNPSVFVEAQTVYIF